MAEFSVNYQRPLLDERREEKQTHTLHRKSYKLLMECLTAFFTLSITGNIVLYSHAKSLKQQKDKHLLAYDSLFSVKLMLDKKLMEAEALSPK